MFNDSRFSFSLLPKLILFTSLIYVSYYKKLRISIHKNKKTEKELLTSQKNCDKFKKGKEKLRKERRSTD